jgi:hypothetical protein
MAQENERSTIVESGPVSDARSAEERQKQGAPERVTVNLTARSVRAMNNLVTWTGYTKTDTINRALQIYEFVQQIIENGGTVHVRQREGAELERLTLF